MIYENENTTEGMIKVLKDLQQYQPAYGEGADKICYNHAVAGDQLTIERAINAAFLCANGFEPEERFEGLHYEVADFHADIKIMQVRLSQCTVNCFQL